MYVVHLHSNVPLPKIKQHLPLLRVGHYIICTSPTVGLRRECICSLSLHKWCLVIDDAWQLLTPQIGKAAHVTERLGDEITLCDICREAGVVNCCISTVRYYLSMRAGLGGARSQRTAK